MAFNPAQPRESDGRFGTVHRGDPGQLGLDAETSDRLGALALSALTDDGFDVTTEDVYVIDRPGRPLVQVYGVDPVAADDARSAVMGAALDAGMPAPDVALPGVLDDAARAKVVRAVDALDQAEREVAHRVRHGHDKAHAAGWAEGCRRRVAELAAPVTEQQRESIVYGLRSVSPPDRRTFVTTLSDGCLVTDHAYDEAVERTLERCLAVKGSVGDADSAAGLYAAELETAVIIANVRNPDDQLHRRRTVEALAAELDAGVSAQDAADWLRARAEA